MKRRHLPPLLLASVFGLSGPASAQDAASQIVGVWKVQKYERCAVDSGRCEALFGDKPSGYVVYTKSGVFLSQVYATLAPTQLLED